MNILIITHFGDDYSKTDNDRFLYLAKLLTKGNDVEIVTSDFQHTKKKHRKESKDSWPFKITYLHEPGYKKNVCLRRFYSHYVWGKNVEKYLKTKTPPDIIYCAVPSLTGPYKAAQYSKNNKSKFIIDVQDLWPEAFQMIFNIPIISKVIFYPFKWIADKIYSSADEIVAVSKTYAERALKVNKKCRIGHSVFLGTELDVFDRKSKKESIYKKEKGEFWIGYCGTLGSSYDLTSVFDALDILKKKGMHKVRFMVMGSGPRETEFHEYAKSKNLNVTFTGRVPYDEMCALISKCDVAVNPIMHNAAQSIINKHADYAAAGIPVVSTQESREYRTLVEKYHMGFNCQNGNAQEIADKIQKLILSPEMKIEMGRNARKCAEEVFDMKVTYKKLKELITG